MSYNHHDEVGPSFSRLYYESEFRNECRALSFNANPKKFLNADTFSFVEPQACGPPFSVGSIGWIRQVKVNVRSSKAGASLIYRSRSGAKTNTPDTYCTLDLRPGPLSNRNQPPLHCARTVERPATSVHRYRFILRTWFNLTTLHRLVRSPSCLVRRNWTKQRKESARPEQRPTKTVIT